MCAAPKGNKFALGNSGTSKKWATPEDLQQEIDAYFKECENNTVNYTKDGTPITEPYTIEGLALALDCCIDTLRNYEKKKGYEEYFATIKKAKLKVQRQKVINGLTGKSNPTITIFDLKNNHGYKDKTEVDNSHELKQPMLNITYSKRSDKEKESDKNDVLTGRRQL